MKETQVKINSCSNFGHHSFKVWMFLLSFFFISNTLRAEDPCKTLLKEFNEVEEKISDIEAERALTKAIKNMTTQMQAVIDDLNKSKKSSALYEKNLKVLELLISEHHEDLVALVKGTKAGTKKLKDALASTTKKLSGANIFFNLYLEHRKKGNNTDPAKSLQTLSDSFNFLQGQLKPLIKFVPVIGQFLKGYSEALKSAVFVANKLQAIRNNQANTIDAFPELNGGNPFRFPTKQDKMLKKLEKRLNEILLELEKNNCGELEDQGDEDEKEEIDPEKITVCMEKLSLDINPTISYYKTFANENENKNNIIRTNEEIGSINIELNSLENKISNDRKNLKNSRIQVANSLTILKAQKNYQKLMSTVRKNNLSFPEQYTQTICSLVSDFSRKIDSSLSSKVKNYCRSSNSLDFSQDELTKSEEALSEKEKQLQTFKAKIDKLVEMASDIREERRTHLQNINALNDCIENLDNPFDISGKYWVRDTGDIVIVENIKGTYKFYIQQPSTPQVNKYGSKKGDLWFASIRDEGYLEGLFQQKYLLEASKWGCNVRNSWVQGRAKVWAGGDWLSLSTNSKSINGNCKISETGSVFTIYKVGSKSYNKFRK